MDECSRERLAAANRVLEKLVSTVDHRTSDPSVREHLRTTQEAWTRYVHEACLGEAALYEGGTMAPLVTTECQRRLVKQRIRDVKLVYDELLQR